MIQYLVFSVIGGYSFYQWITNSVKSEHNKRINEMIAHHLELSKNTEDKEELKDELGTIHELHKLIL